MLNINHVIDLSTGEIIAKLPITCRAPDGGILKNPQFVVRELLRQRNRHENIWYHGNPVYLHDIFGVVSDRVFPVADNRRLTSRDRGEEGRNYFSYRNLAEVPAVRQPNGEKKFG